MVGSAYAPTIRMIMVSGVKGDVAGTAGLAYFMLL